MPSTPLLFPAALPRPSVRPPHYEGLLTHPICDDPTAPGALCYPDWEFDHADKTRFSVAGFLWFLRLKIVPDAKTLFRDYGAKAVAEVNNTSWAKMPGSTNGAWTQFSQNQVYSAKDGKKQYFQKCAITLLACELAARDAIAAGSGPQILAGNAEAIHERMSIIPAAWNVDGVRSWVYHNHRVKKDLVLRITEADHQAALNAIDQPGTLTDGSVILDLADGHTVTFHTAIRLKAHLLGAIGNVRAKPGKTFHGKKSSSDNELVERG